MALLALLFILLNLILSIVAAFLYRSSVNLFMGKWANYSPISKLMLRYLWVGQYIHTPHGAGQGRAAGITDPLWKNILTAAIAAAYCIVAIKLFT